MTPSWIIGVMAFITGMMYCTTEALPKPNPFCSVMSCQPCPSHKVRVYDARGCPTCACKDPCKDMICPRTKVCEVHPTTKKTNCVCPRYCLDYSAPVCGSDGKTYGNGCILNVQTCLTNGKVTMVAVGRCGGTGSDQ